MGRRNKNKIKKKKTQRYSEDQTQNPKILNDSQDEDVQDESNQETSESSFKEPKKRSHSSDTSETEDEPKHPKKKKKNPVETNESLATNKKNKISKRQKKREKYAARLALEQSQAKDQTKLQCLNYLSQWKHNRQEWKFMKAKQVWLQKNKFSTQLIPEGSWTLLLEYFESAKGNIKTTLLDDANKIIKQMDEWTESQTNKDPECDTEQSNSTEVVKPDETIYKRARALIQSLQE